MSTPHEVKDQVRISPIAEFALVAAGGALGAVLRWQVALTLPIRLGGIPWSTLVVNLVGCALIGVAAATIGRSTSDRSRPVWWFSVSGLLGGFTTFSTFAVETSDLLVPSRSWVAAIVYVAATLGGGYAATLVARNALHPGAAPPDAGQPNPDRPGDGQA